MSRVPTTVIQGGWIVAYDGQQHRLLRDGVVVFAGDRIEFVGRSWAGQVDRVIDARSMLVTPGFVSTHAHVGAHGGDRLIVDGGRREFLRSGFLNYEPRRIAGGPSFSAQEDPAAAIRFGFACLLRGGATTVVEMGGGAHDGGETMASLAGECGIRLYYSPGYSAGDYSFDSCGRLRRSWNEEAGMRGLHQAAEFIERCDGASDGRVRGMLIIHEAYNATPSLLHKTKELASRLGVGISLHVGEQVVEFHEAVRTTGKTPVGILAAEGFLGPEVILGHCAFVDGHSLTGYPFAGDLETLSKSGCTVAHAPVALSRRGVALESFQRYLDQGVRLSIGTDSYPLDIIAEMRAASIIGKLVDYNNESAAARDVFNAATLGGADALGRGDLGRLAPGAKADIVLIDFERLCIGPVYDPIRTLVHCGGSELVDTVIVAGQTVVERSRLTMWDEAAVLRAVRTSTQRVWDSFGAYHWSGRPVGEVFPPALPGWEEQPALEN